MNGTTIVGAALVAGLVVFLVGAAAWNLAYERPLPEALQVIHAERRRHLWIHLWMIPAMFVTPAGLAGLATLATDPAVTVLLAMASVVYALGSLCWIATLAFRLTVVTWAAERATSDGAPPDGFAALNAWAGSLYAIHMASAYVSFAVLGAAVLTGLDGVSTWLAWTGIGVGLTFLGGFVATRFSGPFNPPFWAHTYTAAIGVALLWN